MSQKKSEETTYKPRSAKTYLPDGSYRFEPYLLQMHPTAPVPCCETIGRGWYDECFRRRNGVYPWDFPYRRDVMR